MANDLFSALRTYLTKISNGEKSPQEVAAALNAWARESGDAIKERIEIEVKKNVSKMGFAKESDVKRIESELREIRSLLKANGMKSAKGPQKSSGGTTKKRAPKAVPRTVSKKKTVKKSASKKS